MPEMVVVLPTLHRGQAPVVANGARFKVVCCGRRWGKTTLATDELVNRMLDGGQVAYLAPTYKMLAHVWREIKAVTGVRGGGAALVSYKNETLHRLELVTGGAMDCWSLDSGDTIRGQSYDFVVVDEAAFMPDLVTFWDNVMRPLLADRKGGAMFCSTPKGFNGFYSLWARGGVVDGWASWQYPTVTNPLMDVDELMEIEATATTQTWQQEYLAEFVADAGGVFRGVKNVTTSTPQSPYTGTFVVGVDWGKSNDFTAISVMDEETGIEVYFDRFNMISWELQRGRLKAICDQWKPRLILAEANSIGEPNIEALAGEGLPIEGFMTTASSKAPLIDGLALAIERGAIGLIDDQQATAELMAYTMERMAGGGWRYGAPQGAHDDSVIARALAWRACGMRPNTMEIQRENLITRRR